MRDLPEELEELQEALVQTESAEQFLHEMAVLAARLVGGDLSCGMTSVSGEPPQPPPAFEDELRGEDQVIIPLGGSAVAIGRCRGIPSERPVAPGG